MPSSNSNLSSLSSFPSHSLGYGIGLRPKHFPDFLANKKLPIDWLEIISENYMGIGGRSRRVLEKLRADYPIATHGVGLSIAGTDPLDQRYLKLLRELVDWLEPALVTDHLCWTSWKGHHSYDLLPFPLTAESLTHIAARVDAVQNFLGRRILLENPSCYIDFKVSSYSEPEFLAALAERSGCGVLLDLNNCIVNSRNLGWDPLAYLERLGPSHVAQFHLAGHSYEADISIDTHDHEVPEAVWELFAAAVQRFPHASALLEWDDHIPSLERMIEELKTARRRGPGLGQASAAENREPPRLTFESQKAPSSAEDPSSLVALQASFFAALTSCRRPEDFLPQLKSSPAGALRGVGVYQHAYPQRIIEVLKNTFPTMHFILEDELFHAVAAHYVEELGLSDFSINYVGEQWPTFLLTRSCPYPCGVPQETIAALAAFDWTYFELLIRADDPQPRLTAADLASWSAEDWESGVLRLGREASLLALDWEIFGVWTEVQENRVPPPPSQKRELCLFKRADGHLIIEKLDSQQEPFWQALREGARLDQLVDVFAAEDPEAAVGAILEIALRLANEGLLVKVA